MKTKSLSFIVLIGLIIFSTANAFALITVPLKCSNALPDGNDYATVKIELQTGSCSGYNGVKITTTTNQSVLVPGSNFGIQKFGFNYIGDPKSLQITVYEEDGITVDSAWTLKYAQNISEFGVFMDALQTTGKHRHDPLIIKICKVNTNLSEADFNVANSIGYNFVAHIADFTYGSLYYDTDSAFFADCPTLIELSSFTAKAGNKKVTLNWVTEAELDNAGFNILRSTQEAGPYVQVNAGLIPAKGSSSVNGVKYQFIDQSVQNREEYFYILEDIDTYGITTQRGPVSATPRFMNLFK